MRILVVDDDDFSAQVISGMLRNLGFEIIRGRNGAEAMRLLVEAGRGIHLVISDVYMPEMDGLELFSTVKRHTDLCRTPVVLMSGLADLNLVSAAVKIGCAHFLVKPVARDKVQAKVRELLPSKRLWLKDPKELLLELSMQNNQLVVMMERFHAQTFRLVEELTLKMNKGDIRQSLAPLVEMAEILGTDDLRDVLKNHSEQKHITAALLRDLEDLQLELESFREKIVHRAREEAALAILLAAEEKRRKRMSERTDAETINVAGRLIRRDGGAKPAKVPPQSPRVLSNELLTTARNGEAQAQFEVGLAYLRGYGTISNETTARDWLEKAAAQEHSSALVHLAVLLLQSIPLKNEASYDPAIELLTRAVQKESGEGKYWLQQVISTPHSLEFLQMARMADPKAQYKLGVLYQDSVEFEPNYLEAAYWLGMSSRQGYVDAQYRLALIHLDEKTSGGAPRDAVSLFRSAAELDHAEAQYSLARMYNLALGVSLDINLAIHWYERAARQGHVKAQFELAHIWESSAGVKQDVRQALRWYLVCAASGFALASERVADLEKYLPQSDISDAESQARVTLESIGSRAKAL